MIEAAFEKLTLRDFGRDHLLDGRTNLVIGGGLGICNILLKIVTRFGIHNCI